MPDIPVRTRSVPTQVNKITPIEMAEQELTIFVESQISKMRGYQKLGATSSPTFHEINEALVTYQDTLLALLALHSEAKMGYIRAKEEFEDWYAEKYIIVRDEVNPRSLSSQKWLSQKEIDMHIRVQHKQEYQTMNAKVNVADHKLQFMRRLLEGWNAQQFILSNLSKNIIAEVSSLGLDSALDRGLN